MEKCNEAENMPTAATSDVPVSAKTVSSTEMVTFRNAQHNISKSPK